MAKRRRDNQREAYWREVLDRQVHSGLSVKDFCGREQLAESSLYHWRRRIGRRGQPAAAASPTQPAFLPVLVHQDQPAETGDAQIAIDLRGGRVMRLSASMPMEQLAIILRAIEGGA